MMCLYAIVVEMVKDGMEYLEDIMRDSVTPKVMMGHTLTMEACVNVINITQSSGDMPLSVLKGGSRFGSMESTN